MKIFTKAGQVPPPRATWRPVLSDGVRTAVIACPECDRRGSLAGSHEIAGDGTVSPSVVCDCGFHDWIKLEGWTG